MNRNVYDIDCVTWSPQGRVFQIEYAAEAVKQGTCVVGIRSNSHAVLCALRRSVSKLADYNAKVLKVDDHVGVTFSGITSDANLIVKGLRLDCLNHKYLKSQPIMIQRLLTKLSVQSQQNTQNIGKRPYGVGLLVAGYDKLGPHILETTPSGDFIEYYATSFGGRCQSAKTYLENNCDSFPAASLDELVEHALKALATTVSADQTIAGNAVHVGIVGKDQPWQVLSNEELDAKIQACGIKPRAEAAVA